jgi:hypothetical protein
MAANTGVARELTPQEVEEGRRGINGVDHTATEVQALVRNMDASKQKYRYLKSNKVAYEEALKKDNEILFFNYPSLFQMHAEDRVDSTFFEMLALKRKIEKGEITPEEATTIIGKKLYNRFIPEALGQSPSEPTAPKLSYEEYYRRES